MVSDDEQEYERTTEFKLDIWGGIWIRTKFGYYRNKDRFGNVLDEPVYVWRYGKWKSPTIRVIRLPRDPETRKLCYQLIDLARMHQLEYELDKIPLPKFKIINKGSIQR